MILNRRKAIFLFELSKNKLRILGWQSKKLLVSIERITSIGFTIAN